MTTKNQAIYEIGCFWENQSLDFPHFGNSSESKEKLVIELPNQEKENEAKPFISKKRSRENVAESGKKVINAKVKDEKSRELELDARVLAQRERRKKMRDLFDELHSLLPQLPSKADKATIIDGAVDYIKNLQQTLAELEKRKQEKLQSAASASKETVIADHESWENLNDPAGNQNLSTSTMMMSVPPQQQPLALQTWFSPNVVLNISGMEAHFYIFTTKKHGLLDDITLVLENHYIDVLYANLVCDDNNGACCFILVQANTTSYELILDINTWVEEIFKQAAKAIMQCIS